MCVSLCAIRKCPHIIILRWFIKRVLLTLSFESLFWYRHDVSITDWSRFDQQLSEKTEMSSIQSNEASRFRFSVKYLKLTVVLQIVCLVPVPLAPNLIFYMSTSQLLLTNFKDAAFSSHPSIQCCFVMVRCLENWGVVCQIQRPCIQTILHQSHYTKESKALIWMTECNATMKGLLWIANVTTKFQNTAISRSFTAKISSVIFFTVCF